MSVQALRLHNQICTLFPNPDKLEKKKIFYHEITKVRNHEKDKGLNTTIYSLTLPWNAPGFCQIPARMGGLFPATLCRISVRVSKTSGSSSTIKSHFPSNAFTLLIAFGPSDFNGTVSIFLYKHDGNPQFLPINPVWNLGVL
jgi:hypothetical protein